MTEEVLELNEDGSFNIPSPTKKSQNKDISIIELTEEEIEARLSQLRLDNDINSMKSGEFKVYKESDSSIIILVMLSTNEIALSFVFKEEESLFQVKTSSNNIYSVKLPVDYKYNRSSLSSKTYGQLLTAKLSIIL